MTTRRACSWILIAALALASAPASAQAPSFAPNTIWGQVPQGLSSQVATAELLDATGNVVASVPVVGGQFDFANVAPGEYKVQVKDGAGTVLATSAPANLSAEGVVKVIFTGNAVVGAAPPPGNGVPTALIVAAGAVAIGVGTAVVLSKDDKTKPPKSPKK